MLVKYELLKLLRRKSTLLILVVSLLATVFFFGLPVLQFQTYRQESMLQGLEGIAFEKEQATAFTLPLTEDYIAATVREYQQLLENPDNAGYDGKDKFLVGDAYWNFAAPREKLLRMLAGNYDAPWESTGYNRLLPDLDVTNGADFYRAREDKIETLINDPARALSDEQKEYWRGRNKGVETPLQYGYSEGWSILLSSFELLLFSLLAICTVLAPVFSAEYQAGTDAVMLSSKYGKTKLITAKILSSYFFGLLAFSLHVAAALGILLFAFGTDGWNLPVQIINTVIPYPLTFLQATLMNLAVLYLVAMGLIGLTLLLSAGMKSPYLVLTVLVPLLFLPLFLAPDGTTGAYSLTLFLLPYRSAVPELNKYISYQLGGLVLDVHTMRAILYAALTAITLPLARKSFQRHQVSA